jgi:predicted dehydrogenase
MTQSAEAHGPDMDAELGLPWIGGLGVGVIGSGYWGQNYVRILKGLIEVETVAVCDTRPRQLEKLHESFSDLITTTSVDELLSHERIHAVIIATQATAHFDLVKSALEAGKHVLVEKPLTTNSDEALELVMLADELSLTLTVGHTFLYNSAVRKMKEYVTGGDVGDVHYLYSRRTNLGPIRRDVNALWDLAPHDISIFSYLLDAAPTWVSAVGLKALGNPREDVGFVTIGYNTGTIGHLHVSWVDPFKVRELVVVGTQQRIVFNDMDPTEPIRVYKKGVTRLSGDHDPNEDLAYLITDGEIVSPRIEAKEPLTTQVLSFFESISMGTRPESDGRVGLSVVEVMRAIDESLELGGTPVSIVSRVPAAAETAEASRMAMSTIGHAPVAAK